jgi:hypothetical protein
MRRYLLLLALLLPSLAGAQVTAAQKNGLVKAAIDAVAWVRAGGTPTILNGTRISFGGVATVGTPCIRCTAYLDDEDVLFLGLNPAAPALTGAYNRYVVMQVCGAPVASPTYDMPRWLSDLVDTCSTTTYPSTAGMQKMIIAHRTDPAAQSVATGFSAACSTGANCNWTPPLVGGGVGPSVPAPKGVTLPAGSWSGTGCRLKTQTELYGFSSWPPECPNQ